MGKQRKNSAKTIWTEESGNALVGTQISVFWQPENTYYKAMVLSYDPTDRRHKLLYQEDESIEDVELGTGSRQRNFNSLPSPADPLVGADVIFTDKENADSEWFHFMRESTEEMGRPFVVKVVEALEEADHEDVSGPRDPHGQHKYYRIIYLPTEYLATIDFAQVDYVVQNSKQLHQSNPDADEYDIKETEKTEAKQMKHTDPDPEPEAKTAIADTSKPADDARNEIDADTKGRPDDARESGVDRDTDLQMDKVIVPETQPSENDKDSSERDDGPVADPHIAREPMLPVPDIFDDLDDEPPKKKTKKEEKDEAYEPPADVDVAVVGDEDHSSDAPLRTPTKYAHSRGVVEADPSPVDDEFDIDIDKASKVVSADKLLSKHSPGDELDLMVDDLPTPISPMQTDTAIKSVGEGSLGTQDTRDEPLGNIGSHEKKRRIPAPPTPADLFPGPFEDEQMNETASDDAKLGWVDSAKVEMPNIGDYILLKTGSGATRKAFVEAFLPDTRTFFVAFCDTRGGNVQIELNSSNFRMLGDEEGEKIARAPLKSEKQEVKREKRVKISEVEDNNGTYGADDYDEDGMDTGMDRLKPKSRGRPAKRRARSPRREERKHRKRSLRTADIKGQAADASICGRCISIVWPVENLVYVALVLGYSSHSKQHQIVYMVDHCVETLDLRYREWTLLPREKEPWISTGMVGKRVYVFWEGSYDDDASQKIAVKTFGENTRVPYEAYVLSYIGNGKYKIIYTATEDTETRELKVDATQQEKPAIDKEWDLLDDDVRDVSGLPLIGWTD